MLLNVRVLKSYVNDCIMQRTRSAACGSKQSGWLHRISCGTIPPAQSCILRRCNALTPMSHRNDAAPGGLWNITFLNRSDAPRRLHACESAQVANGADQQHSEHSEGGEDAEYIEDGGA